MPAPKNRFKAALHEGRRQTGLWVALANPLSAELLAGVGFDWLLIDLEHAPNDLRSAIAQMQAMSAFPVAPVIRPPMGEAWLIKQLLDAGCQTLLIPMVESVDQAKALVDAVRYPPAGQRGVGAALVRASGFGAEADYLRTADAEICLLVQIETRKGLAALDAIAAIEGIDGLFLGPADLAADMGHLGNPGHEAVRAAVLDAFLRIKRAGKKCGVLTSDQRLIADYAAAGVDFIAIGSDVGLLREAANVALARAFSSEVDTGSREENA
ncbi:HpcH/HpaI aldolase/citrate lyase family protein [Chelatococcus asaccharovorans]|uniref:HpcH/HpaI aldolase/citrate lyase family protein n=1 Tax=Chelatococcus asaccharovorans TaxID=28210 RepID=UPI00224C6B91|nr:HpcH/HpaI aldolase/citrate lyase family protein [Chelatococcus asaccharovorans]CAH1669570.1 4-hydroxy-2-oxo-heptane-1,7-dioate aldolase [Chelatococcus asaccharovorans]CAH1678994.1 4-hydroxy-2-oxo-heptane-1,7-dioate aldolase [Chelatococcus asaccharovorans]